MRLYELLYIIPATLAEEEVSQAENEIQALIQRYNGVPKETRRLGKFKFTYLIKKVRHGHYVLSYFEAEPVEVAKINEALRIHEKVLRHLILRAEEAGGSEFNLVQFQEVVVEGGAKDDRTRRRKMEAEKSKAAEDVKVAAELDAKPEEKTEDEEDSVKEEAEKISPEELDRKIDAALTENT
ncbi:MAG: 30S ribosomal protein S6 [Patescibacteria group bacterium]|nr:30S ribosomal protein S6 [Patescibacteria group bacterium]